LLKTEIQKLSAHKINHILKHEQFWTNKKNAGRPNTSNFGQTKRMQDAQTRAILDKQKECRTPKHEQFWTNKKNAGHPNTSNFGQTKRMQDAH
jgi:uncharacterized damage-inducible protein DinB